MTLLSREANYVQNPALGAVLLWRFACGYAESHRTRSSPPLPVAFVVLPLVLHTDSFEELARTRSGLRKFAEKFSESKAPREDMLLAIHNRVSAWRLRSLDAVQVAVRARLLTVIPKDGTLMPLSQTRPAGVPASINPLMSNAEKLGVWFSAMSLFELATLLKLRF